jgi:hypothetical protein
VGAVGGMSDYYFWQGMLKRMALLPPDLYQRIVATPVGGVLRISLVDVADLMTAFGSVENGTIREDLLLYQRCIVLCRDLVVCRINNRLI